MSAWQIAALPYGKSCSAYAAKLISSTLKKNFLPTIFQFTKTVDGKHVLIVCPAKNYVSPQLMANIGAANLWWDRHFADQISMLHNILQHAAACRNCAETALHWHQHYFLHLPHSKIMFCFILPCGIVWTHHYVIVWDHHWLFHIIFIKNETSFLLKMKYWGSRINFEVPYLEVGGEAQNVVYFSIIHRLTVKISNVFPRMETSLMYFFYQKGQISKDISQKPIAEWTFPE